MGRNLRLAVFDRKVTERVDRGWTYGGQARDGRRTGWMADGAQDHSNFGWPHANAGPSDTLFCYTEGKLVARAEQKVRATTISLGEK